jgi:hypothetical protein
MKNFYQKENCMKNRNKLTGIIALAAIMVFAMTALSLTGCDDGGGGGGDSGYTGSSIAGFGTWLAAQSDNTDDDPYDVKLSISDLGGRSGTQGSLGAILIANNNKYV